MPTQYQGAEEEVRSLNAYIKFIRAAEALTARLSQGLAAEKLTMSQFGALEALLHLGPLSQSELGSKLLKSSGNITMVVDNLEKRGLVERQRSAQDRRVVVVRLSDSGRELIQRVFPVHLAAIVDQMRVLSSDEQETLGRLCRRIGLNA